MRSSLLFLLLLAPFCARADQPTRPKMLSGPATAKGTVVREVWYERNNPRGKLGWVQILTYQGMDGDQPILRTVQRAHLRYLRSGDAYQEEDEEYTVEDYQGKVLELGYRTSLGKNQDLVVRGRPRGNRILLEVLDHAGARVIYRQEKPWDGAARGLYFQDKLLEGKDLSVGRQFRTHAFMASLNAVVPTTYTVLGRKTVSVRGQEREVVHVDQRYPKELFLDKNDHYLDPQTGETLVSMEENALFGNVEHQRVSKQEALAAFPGEVKDIEAPVTIDKPLPLGLLGLPKKLRIRIEMSEDDNAGTVFVADQRQQCVKKEGKSAELCLAAKILENLELKPEPQPGKEYLQSNFYIRSDDAEVKRLAEEAIGDATQAPTRMERITRWVKKKVRGDYEVGFATADEVARTLEGDCTEMGILSAAMARSLGIPARICFGLVYDPEHPGFGGHLWTEAWVDGAWQPFDATGVIPLMGAAYLKIDGYSFKDVLNPDELAAVRRAFAGKMRVTVLETK